MNKVIVLTSIIGLNNKLVDPREKFEGVDYVAFVDRRHKSNVWKQINTLDFSLDNMYTSRRNAKIYKILPNFFYEKNRTPNLF